MGSKDAIKRYRDGYAKLLRLYPRRYRERFGEGMEQTFTDLLREQTGHRAGQNAGLFGCALKIWIETSLGIIKEHLIRHNMGNLAKRLGVWAVVVAAILMIPVLAHWPWSGGDFVFGIVVLFGSACIYEFISRKSGNSAYRYAVGIAVAASLVMVWINAAVGIIGNEDRPANLLFFAVLLIGVIGSFIVRFKARGMSKTLFVMAAVEMLVPVIALIVWPAHVAVEKGGAVGVFILCGFFAALFVGSGMLFRRADNVLRSESGVVTK